MAEQTLDQIAEDVARAVCAQVAGSRNIIAAALRQAHADGKAEGLEMAAAAEEETGQRLYDKYGDSVAFNLLKTRAEAIRALATPEPSP